MDNQPKPYRTVDEILASIPKEDRLESLLKAAKEVYEAMSPEEKEEMMRKQRDGWVKAEMQWAKDFAAGLCERD